MQHDLILVIGLFVLALSIPSIVSAYADSRPPRVATLVLLIGGGLVVFALTQKPGGYTLDDIPHAITRVVAHYMR